MALRTILQCTLSNAHAKLRQCTIKRISTQEFASFQQVMPVFDLNQYQLRSCAENILAEQMSAVDSRTGQRISSDFRNALTQRDHQPELFVSIDQGKIMKSIITTSMLAVLALSTPAALAAESPPAKPMAGKSMGMMDDKHMAQMQDNMKRMQEQMDKIHQTKDPKERQKLMQEHMKTMHSNMQMMRGMGGPMMGGQGGGPMAGMDPKQRQDMMEKRMDMMQMMMEQMMQHDHVNQGIPPK